MTPLCTGAGGRAGPGRLGAMSSRRAALLAAVTDVGRLVLPVECPGCGHLDTPLCAACAAALTGRAARCEAAVPRLDRMDGTPPPPRGGGGGGGARQVSPSVSLAATGP